LGVPADRCSRLLAAFCLASLLLAFAACSSEKTEIQIREAIRQHLASRTDLSKMELVLDGVDYDGTEATARVTIKAREDEKAQMQWVYQLRKVGSEWQVQPSDAGAGHGGGSAAPPSSGMPPGHPTTGGTQPGGTQPGGMQPQGGSQLPPGHPPLGADPPQQPQQQPLPKGHPPTVTQ